MSLVPEKPTTPPPVTPAAHSLLVSALPVTENDDRWLGGLVWVPEVCGVSAGVWDPYPVDEAGDPLPPGDNYKSEPVDGAEQVYYHPFTVELESVCSASLHQADLKARALRQLEAYTPTMVEGEFWDGTLRAQNFSLVRSTPATSVNPTELASAGSAVSGGVVGTAVTPETALALLTTGLSKCSGGNRGFIHAPAALVELWTAGGGLRDDGPRLVTKGRGDIVVAYSGGTGRGPGGSSASLASMWAYATGPVQLRLSGAEVYADMPSSPGPRSGAGQSAGAMHTRTNKIRYRVERQAAVTADPCCAFAVSADLT